MKSSYEIKICKYAYLSISFFVSDWSVDLASPHIVFTYFRQYNDEKKSGAFTVSLIFITFSLFFGCDYNGEN
jgi:hypothetical protein